MDTNLSTNCLSPTKRPLAVKTLMGLLTCALLFVSLSPVHALTLSRPLIRSQIGQPLRLEIDVVNISPDESVDLQASLAEPSSYKGSNIVPNAALEQAQLKLLSRADGSKYLQIEGSQPVIDPFIEILVSLKWASGSILRDLGIFLSTPANDSQSGPTPQSTSFSGSQVIVKEGDSASKIVLQRMDASQLSLDQMLLALLKSNPVAFIGNNVNLVKAGSKLEIPSTQEALKFDKNEARETVILQAKEFANYRAKLANQLAVTPNEQNTKTVEGRITSTVKDGAERPKDQLKLSSPEVKGSSKESSKEEKIVLEKQNIENKERANDLAKNIEELAQLSKTLNSGEKNDGQTSEIPKPQQSDSPAGPKGEDKSYITLIFIFSLLLLIGILVGVWRLMSKGEEYTNPIKASDPSGPYNPNNPSDTGLGMTTDSPLAPVHANDLSMQATSAPPVDDHKQGAPQTAISLEEIVTQDPTQSQFAGEQSKTGLSETPPKMQFNFDLDLPSENSGEPFIKSTSSPVFQPATQNALIQPPKPATANTSWPGQAENPASDALSAGTSTQTHAGAQGEENVEVEDPFKVRMDLAEELWKLGQKHTGRALAQEVAEQASLDMQDRAKRWLAEHAQ